MVFVSFALKRALTSECNIQLCSMRCFVMPLPALCLLPHCHTGGIDPATAECLPLLGCQLLPSSIVHIVYANVQ